MISVFSRACIGAGALAISHVVAAGTGTYFNPLVQSTAVAAPNHINELNSPWQTPPGFVFKKLLSLRDIEADVNQSIVRVPGLGSGASMFDMLAFDPKGQYLFIPHETANGAGGSRYNMKTGRTHILFAGDASGERGVKNTWGRNDWGAFDPVRFTPAGTLWFAEEWSGLGRVIEVLNPFAKPERIRIRELNSIPNVAHEGIHFSKKRDAVMYFIDENNSGSIYKMVFDDARDYAKGGRVFVLKVRRFDGDPAKNWDDPENQHTPRTGRAEWVRLVNTKNDPFRNGISGAPDDPDTFGGRPAADEVGGTPYGRPEDAEVGRLKNGNEVLYFTATSERAVYSVEMLKDHKAIVRLFASDEHTPKNNGFHPTTAELNSPDNLAQDALGNIYIIEDAPNSSDIGGDIWFARDRDNDGVAESVDHFMSLQVSGAEHTGMIFNPVSPTKFVIAVQHPSSTDLANVPDGLGDAVWLFDLSKVVPPRCKQQSVGDQLGYSVSGRNIQTCLDASEFNFVRRLRSAVYEH